VKSRLLRARLQLREKLTRYFKRKGDDALLTCKDFLSELSEYLDEAVDTETRLKLEEQHRRMPQLLGDRDHQEDRPDLQGHGALSHSS